MSIDKLMTDKAILEELGQRLSRRRIMQEMTQEYLANEAGISKRTLERLESGQPSQFLSVVRVLRALNMLGSLETAIPEVSSRPMDVLRMKGKKRQRVSTKKKQQNSKWSWGEE